MTVEVLNDGKGNRAFRALNIKCWNIVSQEWEKNTVKFDQIKILCFNSDWALINIYSMIWQIC